MQVKEKGNDWSFNRECIAHVVSEKICEMRL